MASAVELDPVAGGTPPTWAGDFLKVLGHVQKLGVVGAPPRHIARETGLDLTRVFVILSDLERAKLIRRPGGERVYLEPAGQTVLESAPKP